LNDLTKNILLWVIIVVVLLAVFSRYLPPGNQLSIRKRITRR
jgi:hypothetical protein